MKMRAAVCMAVMVLLAGAGGVQAQEASIPGDGDAQHFQPMDVFGLEWATDPQISPDGSQVVYVRNFFDVMTDGRRTNLWLITSDGARHRPLTSGTRSNASPRWSPGGDRLLWVSSQDGSAQLWLRWMDTGQEARITNLTESPGSLTWSPDGQWIAFTMFVEDAPDPALAMGMPAPPEGAEWAAPAVVIDEIQYRADGQTGFVREGNTHVFVVPAEGGTPRQVTSGPYNHGQPAWMPDGESLVVSANRRDDADFEPNDSDLYQVSLADGSMTRLTDRYGPDGSPAVSPDGSMIAWTGFDDRLQGYQVARLYVMNRDGTDRREIQTGLDRDVEALHWSADGRGLYVQYTDEGDGRVAYVTLSGDVRPVAENLGGTSLGRPYSGGSFSVTGDGVVAYTLSSPLRPAEVAMVPRRGEARRLTRLNEDLLGHKTLGQVEEIWWESSFDGRPVQGWIVRPPDFDPGRRYPLVLEIHGGPFAAYGPHFSAEAQLYAAAGNVVLYTNPRGSTSYGEEFGNLIHHAYPGNDYDDLMSGVDAVLEQGPALRHRRVRRRRSHGVDRGKDGSLRRGGGPEARHQLGQLRAPRRRDPVLRQVLVRPHAVGRHRALLGALSPVPGGERLHTHHAGHRGGGLPHAHVRNGAVLRRPEARGGAHGHGPDSRGVPWHRRPTQPAAEQGGPHSRVVQPLPGPGPPAGFVNHIHAAAQG